MSESEHPMARALQGGEWVTPGLVEMIAKSPILQAGMANPRYQAALQELQKDPEKARKKFESDPGLKVRLQ